MNNHYFSLNLAVRRPDSLYVGLRVRLLQYALTCAVEKVLPCDCCTELQDCYLLGQSKHYYLYPHLYTVLCTVVIVVATDTNFDLLLHC